MPTSVEKEKLQDNSEVQFVPETPEIPAHIEKGGVSATPTQVTAQVVDDTGQPLIKTPSNQTFTITLPADDTQLKKWSKGNIVDALTWFALFWLRAVKKATHFGWKVISGSSKQS